jgi:DNA-directed RNA polymerase specialized sigma24 family protein
MDIRDEERMGGAQDHFLTTHWSVVLAAGGDVSARSQVALETLCRAYWYPLYAHVRRQGIETHEAQDLTQGFFARLLENNYLAEVDREKGRFRSFLLAALKHFLCNEWDKQKALKRGGGRTVLSLDDRSAEERFQREPSAELAPDEQFDKAWALALLEQAMIRLQAEQVAAGREAAFTVLKRYLAARPAHGEYETLTESLGMTANAIGVAVSRLRQRYRELIEAEVANTVSDRGSIADEMRHLLQVLSR